MSQNRFDVVLLMIGGTGTVLWWTFRRHIKRVDNIESLLQQCVAELAALRGELSARFGSNQPGARR